MRTLFTFILIIAVAVGFGLALDHSGSMTIWWFDYRVDFSTATFFIFLIIFFVLLLLVFKIISFFWNLPERAKIYNFRRIKEKNEKLFFDSLVAFFQNDFNKSFSILNTFKKFKFDDDSNYHHKRLISFLGVIVSKKLEKKEVLLSWLDRLSQVETIKNVSIKTSLLFKSEIYLQEKKNKEAIETLKIFLKSNPKNIDAIKLLIQAFDSCEKWEEILHQVRILENKHAKLKLYCNSYKVKCFEKLLKNVGKNIVEIKKIKGLLKPNEKLDILIVKIFAEKWIKAGQQSEAIKMIEPILDKEWSSELSKIYRENHNDLKGQLKKLDILKRKYDGNSDFHLTYGYVCKKEKLWAKAIEQFELSVSLQPSSCAYVLMAETNEEIENFDEAALHWRRAATLRT